jgi:hypothetical protein
MRDKKHLTFLAIVRSPASVIVGSWDYATMGCFYVTVATCPRMLSIALLLLFLGVASLLGPSQFLI